jgi:hypothetical protein
VWRSSPASTRRICLPARWWTCSPRPEARPGSPGPAAPPRRRCRSAEHAQQVTDGLHLVAPAGAEQASTCVATLNDTAVLGPFTRDSAVAIVDCGRLDPGSPALNLAAKAAVTLLVVRPRVSDLSHLAPRIAGLSRAGLRLGLLLPQGTGQVPAEPVYPAQEISATLDVAVYGSIPADPGTAAHLISSRGAPGRTVRRHPLIREAASLAAALAATTGEQPGSPAPPGSVRPASDSAEVTVGDRHL